MLLSRAELHAFLDSLPEDEPVYLLRGADPSAGTALRAWARQHRRVGGGEASALAVEAVAKSMDAWTRAHPAATQVSTPTASETPTPGDLEAPRSLVAEAVVYKDGFGYPGDTLVSSKEKVLSSRKLGVVATAVLDTGDILVVPEDLDRLQGQLHPGEDLVIQALPGVSQDPST